MVKLSKRFAKSSNKSKEIQSNEPGVATSQWLTYVFWAGAAIAASILVGMGMTLATEGYSQGMSSALYAVIALVIILPIALISDRIYSKKERPRKVGIGLVLMVLHAVIFAIVAVVALATALYILVQHLLFDDGSLEPLTVAAVAGWLAITFGLIVLRIVRGDFARLIKLVVLLATIAVLIWGIAGPVSQAVVRRDDDRAERAMQDLYGMITMQAANTGSLPADIKAAIDEDTFNSPAMKTSVKNAADAGLVTYTPNVQPAEVVDEDGYTQTVHYFELCVTYKYDNPNRTGWYGTYPEPYITDDSGVSKSSDYENVYTGTSTEAGTHCYQYKTASAERAVRE